MAPFKEIIDADGRVLVDWDLMQNSAVTLFSHRENFEFTYDWLQQHNYAVHPIDCSDPSQFNKQVSDVLEFSDNYGHVWNGNLDALNDAMGDIEFEDVTGVVFALVNFDRLATSDYEKAHGFLDIVAWNSRFFLLMGHRLLAIVYSEDRELSFASLGAQSAIWSRVNYCNRERSQ